MRSLAHHVRTAGTAALVMAVCGSLRAGGQEVVTALDRTLQKTHMRQEATRVTFSTTPVSAFAPTTHSVRESDLLCTSGGLEPVLQRYIGKYHEDACQGRRRAVPVNGVRC